MEVALINPEIPFNTGNIGRTCVAAGCTLHLVGRLGFKINDREIRRSGLDYWPKLKYRLHENLESFLDSVADKNKLVFFSTKGKKTFWQAPYSSDSYLVFGSESSGFPKEIYTRFDSQLYRIPISPEARSLNLSASAAIAIYEAVRQTACPSWRII